MVDVSVALITWLVIWISSLLFLSALFFFHPLLLHRLHPAARRELSIFIIGHRGTREGDNAEQTTAALASGANGGADAVEFDLRLTKDKEIVVFHDADLNRLCGRADIIVEECSLAELQNIPMLAKGGFIASLEEALDAVPEHCCVLMEFKQGDMRMIDSVHLALEEKRMLGRCLWFSLQHRINTMLRAKDDKIPLLASSRDVILVLLGFYLGFLPFLPLKNFSVFGLPLNNLDSSFLQGALKGCPVPLCDFLANTFGGDPPKIFARRGIVSHLSARGIPTYCLGGDHDKSLNTLLGLGAAAVVTYRPTEIARRRKEDGGGGNCVAGLSGMPPPAPFPP